MLGVNDTLTRIEPGPETHLFVGGTNGFFYFRSADTIYAISAGDKIRVNDLSLSQNAVVMMVGTVNSAMGIFDVTAGELVPHYTSGIPTDQLTAVAYPTFAIFLGTAGSGIYVRPTLGDPFTRVPVPGPTSNDLVGGGVTGDGYLYAISRQGDFARVKNDVWTTITAPDVEKISATIGDDGSVWVGTFGQGAIQYLPDGTSRTFNGANSELHGPNLYSAEVGVINGMYTDPSGRVWFSSYQASPMRPLVMFDPHDSTLDLL